MKGASRVVLGVLVCIVTLFIYHADGVEVCMCDHPFWGGVTDADRAKTMSRYAQAGITTVRVDVGWSALEENGKGTLKNNWLVSWVNQYLTEAEKYKIKVIIVVMNTPVWASSTGEVNGPPKDMNEFKRFMAEFSAMFKGRVYAYEIWNEPDPSQSFWTGTVAQYTTLLKNGYAGVKQGDPDALVILAGTAQVRLPWYEGVYANGGKGYFDIMGAHPYEAQNKPADTPAPTSSDFWHTQAVKYIRQIQQKYNDIKPMIFTEFGYSYYTDGDGYGISEVLKAQRAVDAIKIVERDMPYVPIACFYVGTPVPKSENMKEWGYGWLEYKTLTDRPAIVEMEKFLKNRGSAPTPSTTPTTPTAAPTPTNPTTPTPPPSSGGPTVINNAGWVRSSARANVADNGDGSITMSVTDMWANVEWINKAGFSLAGYTHFTFSVKAGQAISYVQVAVWSGDWTPDITQLSLGDYGGEPVTSGYKNYQIPLTALRASGVVNDILIVDVSQKTNSVYYIKDIAFKYIKGPDPTPPPPPQPSFTVAQVLTSINQARKKAKLSALKTNGGLTKIAQIHAAYMAKAGKVTTAPALSGRAEVRKNYYPWSLLKETVAGVKPSATANTITAKWLATKAFKKNMMAAKAVHFGCGMAYASNTFWVSCEFGKLGKKKSRDETNDSSYDEALMDDESYGNTTVTDKLAMYLSNSEVTAGDTCVAGDCELNDTRVWNPRSCYAIDNCKDECTTTTTCAGSNYQCGSLFDGCTSVACGACAAGEICQRNIAGSKCVATQCPNGCPKNARCVNGECKCPAGSALNEDGDCAVVISQLPSDNLASYTLYNKGEWSNTCVDSVEDYTEDDNGTVSDNGKEVKPAPYVPCGIQQSALDTTTGLAVWKGSYLIGGSVLILSAKVNMLAGNNAASLVFGFQDQSNYGYLKCTNSGQIYFGVVEAGEIKEQQIGEVDESSLRGWFELSVLIRDNSIELKVNGERYPSNKVFTSKSLSRGTAGSVGVLADGPARFGDIMFRSRVKLLVKGNMCEAGKTEQLSYALQIDPAQITVECSDSHSRKRDATSTVYIEGTPDYPSHSLQEDLQMYFESADEALANNGMQVEGVSTATDVPAGAEVTEIIVVSSSVASAAIGAGAIAGIAVGGAAAVGAAVAATVVVKKKRATKKVPVTEQEADKQKPKGAGANVFEFDPTNHTSITGRSQASKV